MNEEGPKKVKKVLTVDEDLYRKLRGLGYYPSKILERAMIEVLEKHRRENKTKRRHTVLLSNDIL